MSIEAHNITPAAGATGIFNAKKMPRPEAVVGKAITGPQQRALRKPLRALAVAIRDLAPRRAPTLKRQRLLYRHAATLTDSDIDRLVVEIGVGRMWAAVERSTRPLSMIAAE